MIVKANNFPLQKTYKIHLFNLIQSGLMMHLYKLQCFKTDFPRQILIEWATLSDNNSQKITFGHHLLAIISFQTHMT